jgi:hypothetical protein
MNELDETHEEVEEIFMTPPFDDDDYTKKLIALAYSQAAVELESGTASSQIVTHFLRLGAPETVLKNAQMELQNELLAEKIKSEREAQKIAGMVDDVLKALRSYTYIPPGAADDHLL